MNYKVESDFDYNGYRCVVVFQKGGHRCGYVGVSQAHPLYKIDHTDKIGVLKFDDIKDQKIGKRGAISIVCMALDDSDDGCVSSDIYFDVHGGITFSGDGDYPVKSDLWWFGFDCNHFGDRKDYNQILEYGLDMPGRIKYLAGLESRYGIGDEVIRTMEYVEQECKNLADQLRRCERRLNSTQEEGG